MGKAAELVEEKLTACSSYFFEREEGFGITTEKKTKKDGYSKLLTEKEMKKEYGISGKMIQWSLGNLVKCQKLLLLPKENCLYTLNHIILLRNISLMIKKEKNIKPKINLNGGIHYD